MRDGGRGSLSTLRAGRFRPRGLGGCRNSADRRVPRGWVVTWELSNRFDKRCLPMADRHYSRQKPGTSQFVKPGRCLVLWQHLAYWVTSWPFPEYTKHAWAGAWECSAFRNEGAGLSSELILEAVAATRWRYGDPPALGMVTFVDEGKIKRKRDPGRCFLKAGFKRVGKTGSGLLVF